jgi:hypothetical protein
MGVQRDFSLDPQWDYVLSDYLTLSSQETEADVPVPDRPLPQWKISLILASLKRSQKIGILCWLASQGLLTLGGRERLLSLQSGASLEALLSAEKFAHRLSQDEKLQKDFIHAMRGLNSRPHSKTFRRKLVSRIGVGYRDKGTLPVFSTRERQMAQRDAWIPLEGLPEYTQKAIQSILPFCLSEDESCVDLQLMSQALSPVWALPESWTRSH